MAEIAVSVACEVAKCLLAPVSRHCGYVIFSDRCVRQLNVEVKKLGDTRDEVQHSIDDAQNNMKPIKAKVETWVKEVETVADKAHEVLDYDGRAKKTCFYGWLPNPKARYCLGNEASKMIKEIKDLIERGQFERVYDEISPPGLVGGAPDMNSSAGDGGDFITDSRTSIFQGIMKALDDEKLKVIGVYGPGGVGKTTVLEIVEKKLRKEGRPFQMIVKSKVSQTPNLTTIQHDIAYALGLKNLKDEPSEEGRRDLLFKRLQKDPREMVLIILDDLWMELDLKAIGVPLKDESMGCKLLLTSRDQRVLDQKMHADQIFRLEGLNNDEAFKLFEKTVGDRLKDDEELRAKSAQVVSKLAGLPLLITSVASTLKYSNVSAWENALIKIEDPNIEKIVKWSYDHLESEDVKSLFLLCGLIGGTIEVELLLGLGMGLGLFEGFNDTIQNSRNRLNTMLDSLHSFSLLQDGGNGKVNVTIHDLYSEVIISNAFSGQNSLIINSNYGPCPKEKLEKCWACLVNVGSNRLAELMLSRFSHVKILMLSEQYDMLDCNRMDFVYMEDLRALHLSAMHITSLPSSMEILKNLQSLSINFYVNNVANLGKLKALRILSFAGSAISRLPKEIGELTNLRSLNLSYCYSLEIIEPGALKGLINLEELYMKGSFDQWMNEDEIPSTLCNAKLVECKSLTKLTALEISIPDPTVLFKDGDLPFGNLINFWINIGNAGGREFEGLRTMKLKLEGHDNILSKEWVQKTLQKTQYLHLDGLREFKNAHELGIQGFPQLKHLSIQNNPSIKYIASSFNDLLLTTFTVLESLFLENLNNIEKICHGPIVEECFSKLKAVSVINCNQLKYLWYFSKKQGLVQLEEIKIRACNSMQAIVIDDAEVDKVTTDDKVELPNVRCLELGDLPNITSFCSGAEIKSAGALIQVSLPKLEMLKLERVGSPALENCSKLLNVFSSTIIGRLHNLKEVIVSSCHSLESLFNCGSLDANTEQKIVLLTKLEIMKVDGARRLGHVVKSDSPMALGFPSLKTVYVAECSKLEFLFPYFTATTLEKLEWIKISYCQQMKEVVPKEDGGRSKAEVISFPCLSSLTLSNLHNLLNFSSESCSYDFVTLKDLHIFQCPNFGAFIQNPASVKRQLGDTAKKNDESPQPLFNEMVTFPNIRSLEIEDIQCKELWNNLIPTDSFRKLESIKLKNCGNLQRIGPSQMWKRLQCCLEILKVKSCHSIKIIYEGDETDTKGGKLWRLVLHDLENLRHIWQSDGLRNVPFPNLRYVKVVRCSHLEMLFTTFTAKFLKQIEELVVESCEDIEQIAGHEKWEEGTGMTINFSELTVLRLFELPKFKSFLPKKYSMKFLCSEDFPSLRVLSVKSCGAEPDQVLGDWEWHQVRVALIREILLWFGFRSP